MTRKKSDANQSSIVKALREAGATVQDLHEVGKGCPDILVGYGGMNYLMEIKKPGETLNLRELEWHTTWRGSARIVETAEEAMYEAGMMR